MKDEHRFRDFSRLSKRIRAPEAEVAVWGKNVAGAVAGCVIDQIQDGWDNATTAHRAGITVADVRQILAWDKEVTRG